MNTQTCPYCKEEIYSNAVVCRYCKRDLPHFQGDLKRSSRWVPALVTSALIITGSAFLTYNFLKERKTWDSNPDKRK